MSKKKQNIQTEIKIASGHSSKEVQLYNFVRLLHIIVESEIEHLEQYSKKNIEKIKEYKEGLKDLSVIEENLEKKFESHCKQTHGLLLISR